MICPHQLLMAMEVTIRMSVGAWGNAPKPVARGLPGARQTGRLCSWWSSYGWLICSAVQLIPSSIPFSH